MSQLKPAVVLLVLLTVLTGLAYPLLVTGIGSRFSGSARRSASRRACAASTSAGLSGPRFDPEDAAALYANGLVAERRPQKYRGSSKGFPINAEPATTPSARAIRLPFACAGMRVCAIPLTSRG